MKKTLAWLLTLILCLTAVGSFAYERDANINDPGVTPICKEKVKLTVGIPKNPFVENFDTNQMTLALEKEGNFELEFVLYPAGEMNEKLNLMINARSKDLPDVLIFRNNVNDSQLYTWAQAGALVDLTEYYKESAYHLNIAKERTGVDFTKMITCPDGKIYTIPVFNQSIGNEAPARLWVYRPWLDALGLQAPETLDDFYQMLKAFKEKDPNGNGIADEIPLVSYKNNLFWLRYIMSAFTDTGDNDFQFVKVGVVAPAYTTQAWREGLRFIKKLFDEGLISPLTYTQDFTQYGAMMTGETTIVGCAIDMAMSGVIPAMDARRTEYIGVAPLKGKDGFTMAYFQPSVANPGFAVTTACKNVEAAFRLGDLLVSEYFSIVTRFGFPGVDYQLPVEGDVAMYAGMGFKPTLKPILGWGIMQNTHWQQTGPYIRQYSIAAGMISDGNPTNTEPLQAAIIPSYIAAYPMQSIPKLIYSVEELEDIQETKSLVYSYVDENTAFFVTGARSIETEWDSYIADLNEMNIEHLVKVNQAVYDRMYK